MHGEPEHDRNQSNNQINVAKNQKKKGRLGRRESSAKKHCLPKGFPKNNNPNNKSQTKKPSRLIRGPRPMTPTTKKMIQWIGQQDEDGSNGTYPSVDGHLSLPF
jgi:hypothetical protein